MNASLVQKLFGRVDSPINRRILGAILTVGLFTILGKFAFIAKELVLARTFGTSEAMDCFLFALMLQSFVLTVIAAAFNTALMPTFIRVKECQGTDAAQKLLSSITLCSILILLVISGIGSILGPNIISILASGFHQEAREMTRSLFFILIPCFMLGGISTILSAVLNANRAFALPAVVPAVTPLVIVLMVTLFAKTSGIYPAAVATVIGSMVETGILAIGVRRTGFSFLPRWNGFDEGLRSVVREYIPMVAGAILLGVTPLVDQSMATWLGAGSVAALNFGNRLVNMIVGLGSLSISAAVFPHFSQMVAGKDWRRLRHTLKSCILVILCATIPLMLVLAVGAKPIVRLIYQRGNFTPDDVRISSGVQALASLQIPSCVLGVLFARLISAFGKNSILMWGAAISLVMDPICNLIFMHFWGVAGIGLTTSVIYLISCLYLAAMLGYQLRNSN